MCRSEWGPGWTWLSWSSGWLCGHRSAQTARAHVNDAHKDTDFLHCARESLTPLTQPFSLNDWRRWNDGALLWCFSLQSVLQSSAVKWKQAPELSPSRGPTGCMLLEESQGYGGGCWEGKCWWFIEMFDGCSMAVGWSSSASPLTESLKCWLKISHYQKAIKWIHFGTHNHVLQSTLGQPAVEENRNEDVPYGGPDDLRKDDIFSCCAAKRHLALLAWWSDYLLLPTDHTAP